MSNKIWTRNYDNLFSAVFGTTGGKGGSTDSPPTYQYPCFRASDGSYKTLLDPGATATRTHQCTFAALVISSINSYLAYTVTTFNSNSTFIQLGSGNGSVSKDDYCLFLPETSGFKITNQIRSWEYIESEHKYTKLIKIAINYTGSNPKTITEFGIFGCPASESSGNDNYGYTCLLYHEFLDVPVTLEQNDTIEIKFYQSIVQPNYTPYPSI